MCVKVSRGVNLLRLLDRFKSIYREEVNNDSYIHLYPVGDFWVAFEKSAYFLSLLLGGNCEVYAIGIQEFPYPVLFVCMEQEEKELLVGMQREQNQAFPFTRIKVSFSLDRYEDWHKQCVDSYL